LVFGLAGSMVIVIVVVGALASIISRFWWLAHVGAAVIAWTAAQIVFSDAWVLEATNEPLPAQTLLSLLISAAVLVPAYFRHLHGPAHRQLHPDRVSPTCGPTAPSPARQGLEQDGYVASILALPGVVALGDTADAVLTRARAILTAEVRQARSSNSRRADGGASPSRGHTGHACSIDLATCCVRCPPRRTTSHS
jgi:predicted RNase H-like HicB family nuclease